jgi:ribosomal protein S10
LNRGFTNYPNSWEKESGFAMPQFDNYNKKKWHFEMSTHARIIKPDVQTYNQIFKMQNTQNTCNAYSNQPMTQKM